MLNHDAHANTLWAFEPRVGPYNRNTLNNNNDNNNVDDADATSIVQLPSTATENRKEGGAREGQEQEHPHSESDLEHVEGKGAFLLLATKTIKAGEVVTDYYGRKSNTNFFHQYVYSLKFIAE